MLSVIKNNFRNYIENYDSTYSAIGIGRTFLGIGHLSTLLLTPIYSLTIPLGANSVGNEKCQGPENLLLFCLTGENESLFRIISILILLLVAIGIYPRYTSWLHFYFCISFYGIVTLPDGGDLIARNITLFLAIILLGDKRRWHWKRDHNFFLKNQGTFLQGVAAAGQIAIRIQLFYIYIDAAISKLFVEEWQTGTALYYVFRSEYFGASGIRGEILRWITNFPIGTLSFTWGAMICEVIIALFIISRNPYKRIVALILSVSLHIGIAIAIGIWSFVLIMIGANITAFSGTSLKNNFSRTEKKV